MRLDQHIGYGDLIPQVGSFAAMARIFVGAQIVPRPAVERAVAHARDEVRDEVVAKIVALVGRAPEVARLRMHGEPDAPPRPCAACQRAIAAASRLPMPSPSFVADPTETNICRPSGEKTMPRV